MNDNPSVEERIWAVIAHLSALAMGIGLLLPVVGWSESRRKSRYTSYQCLQALGYQSLGYTIWILVTLIVVVVTSFTAVAGISVIENLEEEIMGIVFAHTTIVFGLIGVYFILPIIGALACAFGKDFRYPILGKRLAKYLGHNPLNASEDQPWLIEDHEDRWVASMGHFSVIIMLWGMLAPMTVWGMQGKRSTFLKFQSIQTLVFQAGTMLLYFASGVLYVLGFAFLLLTAGVSGFENINSSAGMAGLVVFFISMLCVFGIVLLVPLLHIMGQWAGYRILKGDNYRYPVVGKMVEKWILRTTRPSTDG